MVTTYFKNLVADVVWKTAAGASLPETYYLAASTTQPLEDGTGVTEPDSATGYSRVAMSELAQAVDGVTTNSAAISWPKVILDAGAVTHWALFDAAEGGNLLMGGEFDSVKHLDPGTTLTVEAEGLELHVLGA